MSDSLLLGSNIMTLLLDSTALAIWVQAPQLLDSSGNCIPNDNHVYIILLYLLDILSSPYLISFNPFCTFSKETKTYFFVLESRFRLKNRFSNINFRKASIHIENIVDVFNLLSFDNCCFNTICTQSFYHRKSVKCYLAVYIQYYDLER